MKEGSKVTWEAGQARISYTFPNRRSYGNLLLTGLDGADLSNSPYIEIRFRNPSEKLALQAVYSYIDSTGKIRSDWIYFCKNEKHDVFSVRAINVAKDGYSAKKRMERKEEPFKPVKLIYFAIYSHPQKSSTLNEEFMLDYVRVTGTPAGK